MRTVIFTGAAAIIGACFAIKGEDPTVVLPMIEKSIGEVPFLHPQPDETNIPVVHDVNIPILLTPKKEWAFATKLSDAPPYIQPELGPDWEEQMIDGVMYYEGFYKYKYICSGGKKTIGYGCTNPKILAKGAVSRPYAEEVLRDELETVREQVLQVVSVDLSEHQLCALTSFTFNCGLANLKRLVERNGRLNDGNYDSIEKYLPMYRKAGGQVRKGLEKRREWELALWRGENTTEIN